VRIDNLKKMAKALEVDMEILLKDGILPDEFYPIPFTMIAEVNSELIRAYRRKFNLSRRGLAKKCKFTESCLHWCENEDHATCSWENLFEMARVFGVSPLSLLSTAEWPEGLPPCLNYLICEKSARLHDYRRPLLPIGKLFVENGYHLHELILKCRSKTKTKLAISTLRDLFWGKVLLKDKNLLKVEKATGILVGEMKYAFSVSLKVQDLNRVIYYPIKGSKNGSGKTTRTL
jgi:DNA-binding XRE family transcriptional regulator